MLRSLRDSGFRRREMPCLRYCDLQSEHMLRCLLRLSKWVELCDLKREVSSELLICSLMRFESAVLLIDSFGEKEQQQQQNRLLIGSLISKQLNGITDVCVCVCVCVCV